MPVFAILLGAVGFAAALSFFRYTAPTGPSFWYLRPWMELLSDRALVFLLIAAVLFIVHSIFVVRRASPTFWFFALAASSLPALAALWPGVVELDVARHSEQYTDAGGDIPYLISITERLFGLGLGFSIVLALMATYGYFSRRKA